MEPSDLRVLVVEDEEDSEVLVSATLKYHGVQSRSARSAEEALKLIREMRPNLLLVDLMLPGMTGWTFWDNVKSNPDTAHIPAVVLSAYLTPSLTRKALDAGFRACFPKPIDVKTLVGQLVAITEE